MKHIILIDDSKTIRISAEIALKKLGYNIIQAENGSDALDKVNELKEEGDEIALCITDINMPKMNGITFISEFRKIDKYTPVITLTTESEDDIIMQGKEAGATGWMLKPFSPDVLLETVNKLIK